MSDYVAIKLGGANNGAGITVDSKLSLTSSNPVQNKVVTKAIEELKTNINELPDADTLVTTENVENIIDKKLENFSGSITDIEPIDEETIRQLFNN